MLRRATAALFRQHSSLQPAMPGIPATRRRPRSKRLLRLLGAAAGLAGGMAALLPALLPAPASAKQGMVILRDQKHTVYVGDITEDPATNKVDITTKDAGKVSVDKRSLDRPPIYFNSPKEELDARWTMLAPNDVNGRVALGRFAYENKMYEQARDILTSAVQLDRNNRQAHDLLQQTEQQIKTAQAQVQPPPQSAVAPATKPAARPGSVAAKRRLTNDELNRLRQLEWRPEDENVKVQLLGDAKRVAISSGLSRPDDSPEQIGWDIVHKGPVGLRKNVKLNSDPSSLLVYRKDVQKFVVTTCASAQCHNTDKGGNLYLFTAPKDELTDATDYIILQEYMKTIGNREYLMIDRLNPRESLLIQFATPPAQAKVSHPKAAGYTPPAKANLNQLKQIEDWISKLPPTAPDYDIDLSKEPKKEDGKAAGPATPPAAAPASAIPASATPAPSAVTPFAPPAAPRP